MIYVVEPICKGQEHVPFCAAFLNSLQYVFPSNVIVYMSSAIQLKNVRAYLADHNVDVSNITFVSVEAFNHNSSAYNEPMITLKQIQKVSRLDDVKHIFLSTASLQSLFLIYLSRLFNRKKNIYAVLHRATTQLKSNRWYVKTGAMVLCGVKYNDKGVYPIVLSEDIKLETRDVSKSFYKQLRYINHPYLFKFNDKIKAVSSKPKIGFLGLGSMGRGFDLFVETARLSSSHADFYGIGKLGTDCLAVDQSSLKHKMSNGQLDLKNYIDLLIEMDFVMMPFKGEYYSLAVSGVLYDALMFNKPILFLEGHFSNKLLSRYGNIGIMFATISAIVEFLKGQYKNYNYKEIHEKQRACLENFTTSYVSKQIKALINENPDNNH